MKIELKRIEFSERLSEETNAFVADLWVNGKKIAYCKNDGHGGCTDIHPYDHTLRPQLDEAKTYCESLPPVKYYNTLIRMDLELFVDNLLMEYLTIKQNAKEFGKKLIYKNAFGVQMEVTWKGWTITKLLKTPNGIKVLENVIKDLQTSGCTILNTNLGSLLN